jgi:hypothetical protein
MITRIALSFQYIIFLGKTNYMSILTRQERKRLVIELYNQGKTYRETSKEARISPRDIGVILNKIVEEKTEGSKEENNNDADKNKEEEQQSLSLSTQAYKLFSEGKTPLEVSITLDLRESEATKFCREYWKLEQLHNLNMVHEEIKEDDIGYFLKLYKLAKAKGMGIEQVIDVLAIANNDLPSIEEQLKKLRNDICTLQSQKHTCKRILHQLNNQIVTSSRLLNSFRISCDTQRRKIENLNNERARLESIVTGFKRDNEEYLKIKQIAYEEVKSVLTNNKIFLRFATASVIESLKRNPELCNFVLNDISNNNDTDLTSYESNFLSLMLPEQQQQQSFSYRNDDIYSAVILGETEKLYNTFITKLTNGVMATASVASRTS